MECNTFCYSSSLSFCLSFPKMLLILVTKRFYGFSLLLLLLSSFGPLVLAEEDAHFPTASADGINTLCYNHSQLYLQAYFDEEVWALKMYRATGFLSVKGLKNKDTFTTSPGLFEECLSTESLPNSFQGQFCSIFFKIEPDMNTKTDYKVIKERDGDENTFKLPRVGFCIPSSCNSSDLRSSVKQLVARQALTLNLTSSIVVITDENYCYTQMKIDSAPQFDGPDIAVLVVLSFLGLIVLLSTFYEGWRSLTNDQSVDTHWKKLFHCFSALENGRKILSTESTSSDLPCLHGVRVLSATWVILYHAYRFLDLSPTENRFGPIRKDLYEWDMQAFTRGPISVETFFMMSGLLISYSLIRNLQRNEGRFNIFSFYLHRYIRISPVYYLCLGFIATLLVYLGSGPLWYFVHQMSQSCRISWWTHFLYIANYFIIVNPPASECMAASWYLAADMQLFILSPLFVYPLWRWRRAGLAWITFSILVIIGAISTIYVVWLLPATLIGLERPIESSKSLYPNYYIQTWHRLPQHLTGILLGWLILQSKNLKLHKVLVLVGWILSIAIILVVIYGLVPFLNEKLMPDMNPGVRNAYGVLHRFLWAIAVGWVVFACVNGYGGFVNTLLSWKGFIPLGRLSYIAYLVHYDFIKVYHIGLSRTPFYYTRMNATMIYLSFVMVSFILAFFLSITIEMPFINLDRTFFNSAANARKSPDTEMNDEDGTGQKRSQM